MDQTAPKLDPVTSLALEKLNDLAVPAPVSWLPQTWGWLVLALIILALLVFALLRRHKRYVADRYRREALAELARVEAALGAAARRAQAIADIAELLKRVALHAWPRAATASLSGSAWLAFLKQHDGADFTADPARCFLDDLEYHGNSDRAQIDETAARTFAGQARRWIERHHVSA